MVFAFVRSGAHLSAAHGAVAGLAGGVVFGAAMMQLGTLPTVAQLVRADSEGVGLVVHMLIAAAIGAGFGVLMWRQSPGMGEALFWGLAYGALWWFLGPLTLMPLLLGGPVGWDIPAARGAFPSLMGHLAYGTTLGLAFALVRARRPGRIDVLSRAGALSGAASGAVAAWLVGSVGAEPGISWLPARYAAAPAEVSWAVPLVLGVLGGVGFALLYPRPPEGAGPGLIRGMVFGFFCWLIGPLTVIPLVTGGSLSWTVEAARMQFPALVGLLLYGAAVGLLYRWSHTLTRDYLSDVIPGPDDEGIGIEGLRAVGRGTLGGIIGGLVFTLVMVQVGFLPVVARLIGSTSAEAGIAVHLVISIVIGACYGLLFRGQSFDVGSALGWGIAYGFLWWILGALTLMPILLGAAPTWTAQGAGELTASLVGHLAYGAGLGVVFHVLEARYSPWWVPLKKTEAMRAERRRAQLLTSAPALWVTVLVVALTLPVVLAG